MDRSPIKMMGAGSVPQPYAKTKDRLNDAPGRLQGNIEKKSAENNLSVLSRYLRSHLTIFLSEKIQPTLLANRLILDPAHQILLCIEGKHRIIGSIDISSLCLFTVLSIRLLHLLDGRADMNALRRLGFLV